MDQKIETTKGITAFRNVCQNYRDDYKFFSNKFDKLAALVILQLNDLQRKYQKNEEFSNTMLCCFMEAIVRILKEEGSNRFLNQLLQLSGNDKIEKALKDPYQDEIESFCIHLKKNNSLFSDLTLFNMDVFIEKYQKLNPENTEKSYRIETLASGKTHNNKRLTQEDTDFLQELCRF